jgi:hypothetical protein
MADNIPITPGTGTSVATDDVGGVQYQRMKLTLGADGVNDGDVSADNPMPVEGAVTVANLPATQAVSGPLTDAELRATAVPVSGTFYPATQPVSGSVSVSNFPASQAVTGTFWQATQPVSGTVAVSNHPSSMAVTGTFWQATQPVSLASLPALPAGSNTIGGVVVKDSGRVRCCIKFHGTSAVAETLLSVVKQLGDAADPGGATSIGVTSGKRLKITSIVYTLKANAAAAAFATLNVRSLHNGATLIGSPSVLRIEVGLTAATVGSAITETVPCDLEFSGTQTLGITLACQATTNVHSITLMGYEYTP